VVKGEEIIDVVTGQPIPLEPPIIRYPPGGSTTYVGERPPKLYVNGVDVSVLVSRELYFDSEGKPITKSLKDHTRDIINKEYASLNDFLNKWSSTDRKAAIIAELESKGVLVTALQEAVNKEVDLFDLICHVAYDQPPLTRKERANNVKKRNYFTKYGEQSRQVLEALLDKYADEGITTIESTEVLSIDPFTEFGTPPEIIRSFGGKENYLTAIRDLEKQLYA
jgi:type I restriction enzyme, R subunit